MYRYDPKKQITRDMDHIGHRPTTMNQNHGTFIATLYLSLISRSCPPSFVKTFPAPNGVPSGKITTLWKDPPFLMENSTINDHFQKLFPESVWAKGSSNSGGLSNILTSSHLLILTSLHLLILTSSHIHILTSSHLLIFTSSHLHIFSSSHLLIFTSSHLHIFSSSHLLIFSSSHHVFTSSHLHIFSSSHLHILSCPLALLPSCSLLLFNFSLKGVGQCQRDGTKRNPFARNEVRSPKSVVKLRFYNLGGNRFARNEVRSPKTDVKLRFYNFRGNPFAQNAVRAPKTVVKLRFHGSGLCV